MDSSGCGASVGYGEQLFIKLQVSRGIFREARRSASDKDRVMGLRNEVYDTPGCYSHR